MDVILGFFFLFLYLDRIVDDTLIKVLPLAILFYLSLKYYIKSSRIKSKVKKRDNTPVIFYLIIALMSIGVLRNNNPLIVSSAVYEIFCSFILFNVTCYQVFKYIDLKYKDGIDVYYYVIMTPFFMFVVLNLLFWALGIRGVDADAPDIGDSVTLSYLGFNVSRVMFPFTNGINAYGSLIGAVFAIQLVYVFVLGRKNLVSFIFLGSFIVTLLLTDSRLAIVFPILVAIGIYFIKKRKTIKFIRILPWFLIIGPVLLLTLLPLIANNSALQNFSRSSQDLVTGNSRFVIWGFALLELSNFSIFHVVGYGLFGHYASGASLKWAYIFGFSENSIMIHPHNSVLSVIFDYGYIFLILFMYYLTKTVRFCINYWNIKREAVILYLGFFSYFVVISTTESFFGFYYLNAIYFIFAFFFFINRVAGSKTPSSYAK
ncbi:MAG TPA: hypothetical protein VHA56_17485 [Mucilaginibacter sp.]|nr:hypothetical protein [Mucilaginibacter sp.]